MWYIYIYILEVISVMDDLLTKSQVSGMNIYTSVYQFFGVAIQASKCFCASTKVNLHGPPNDGCNNKHSYFGLTNLSMYFLSCSASLKTAIQRGNGWASSHHQPAPMTKHQPTKTAMTPKSVQQNRTWLLHLPRLGHTARCLVGGWTNPFDKYWSKWLHLPQIIFGVNIKQICELPPPKNHVPQTFRGPCFCFKGFFRNTRVIF